MINETPSESLRVMSKGFWVGTVVRYERGYKYHSRISGIGDSRKFWDRAQDSVPRVIKNWTYA